MQRHPGLPGEEGIVRATTEENTNDLSAVIEDDLDNPAQRNAQGVDPMRPSSAIRRAYGINAGEGPKPGRYGQFSKLDLSAPRGPLQDIVEAATVGVGH